MGKKRSGEDRYILAKGVRSGNYCAFGKYDVSCGFLRLDYTTGSKVLLNYLVPETATPGVWEAGIRGSLQVRSLQGRSLQVGSLHVGSLQVMAFHTPAVAVFGTRYTPLVNIRALYYFNNR